MQRLKLLLAVAVVASTAGCGFITGDEPLTFAAEPAPVSDQALSEAGYQEAETRQQVVTQEFTVAGQTREVEVTNELAQYNHSVDLGPLGERRAAVFATFSSPEVSIASRTFNPIADMSNRDLLSRFSSQYDGLRIGQQVETRNHTVLGTEAGVEKYEGTADLGGTSVDVYIHVTTVKHEGDYVVALGIYPQRLSGEEQNVFTMLSGIEHSGEN